MNGLATGFDVDWMGISLFLACTCAFLFLVIWVLVKIHEQAEAQQKAQRQIDEIGRQTEAEIISEALRQQARQATGGRAHVRQANVVNGEWR